MQKKTLHTWLVYFAFVLPVFIPFVLFFILPTMSGLIYALFDWNGISSKMNFVGMKNFITLFTRDSNYFVSLKFSFRITIWSVILGNLISMLLALWVNLNMRTSNFIRAAFFMPVVIPALVRGFLWRFIYNQGFSALYKMIPLPFLNIKMLGYGTTAFYAILIASLWGGVGYSMIIYLAGLMSIDKMYYESADIDGAGSFVKFFHITIPLMMPSITICLFTSIAGSFAMYDMNTALTGGGPGNATSSLVLDITQTAFSQHQLGYGAAKAVVLLVIIMTITLLQVRATRKREVEL
jgi:raffinose/stachyose/melibiose transport system permease protein